MGQNGYGCSSILCQNAKMIRCRNDHSTMPKCSVAVVVQVCISIDGHAAGQTCSYCSCLVLQRSHHLQHVYTNKAPPRERKWWMESDLTASLCEWRPHSCRWCDARVDGIMKQHLQRLQFLGKKKADLLILALRACHKCKVDLASSVLP